MSAAARKNAEDCPVRLCTLRQHLQRTSSTLSTRQNERERDPRDLGPSRAVIQAKAGLAVSAVLLPGRAARTACAVLRVSLRHPLLASGASWAHESVSGESRNTLPSAGSDTASCPSLIRPLECSIDCERVVGERTRLAACPGGGGDEVRRGQVGIGLMRTGRLRARDVGGGEGALSVSACGWRE